MASPSARLVTGIATGTLCNHTVGQSMTSLRPQQARSPSCLAVIHRRCSALAPKTRNNLSCCSVCTRPTVHGLIATELLPDSSNLCNPGWTRRCSADTHKHTHTHAGSLRCHMKSHGYNTNGSPLARFRNVSLQDATWCPKKVG